MYENGSNNHFPAGRQTALNFGLNALMSLTKLGNDLLFPYISNLEQ